MTHTLHIKIKSFDTQHLNTCQNELQSLWGRVNPNHTEDRVPAKHVVCLPTQRSHITVLRSPHVDKKSREQFVFTRVHRAVSYTFGSDQAVEVFLFGLKNLECSGVELTVTLRSWDYFYDTN
jgi:ribosomal protein S10